MQSNSHAQTRLPADKKNHRPKTVVFGYRALSIRRSGLFGRGEGRAQAQLDTPALHIDRQAFYLNLIALADHIADILDAPLGKLRDMAEAFDARKDLDECPEIRDILDRPGVDGPLFGSRGKAFDDLDDLLGGLCVIRGDLYRSVIFDIDARAGGLLDATDGLATRADDRTDRGRVDLDEGNARGGVRQFLARLRERLVHDPKDMIAPFFGLQQRFLHGLEGDAFDLGVQLEGGDAVGGAGDLEVHIAHMILVAEDIGQNHDILALLDHAHRDAGGGLFDGH